MLFLKVKVDTGLPDEPILVSTGQNSVTVTGYQSPFRIGETEAWGVELSRCEEIDMALLNIYWILVIHWAFSECFCSFNTYCYKVWTITISIYRRANWSTEKLSNWSKVTQTVSTGSEIWTQADWFLNLHFVCLLCHTSPKRQIVKKRKSWAHLSNQSQMVRVLA